jgi:hypothetical protein
MSGTILRGLVINTRKHASATGKGSVKQFQKRFSGGHDPYHEPHVPEFHGRLSQILLISTFLWVMYRAKEDNGKIIGMNLPWNDAHHHHDVGDTMSVLNEEEEHEEEEEHDDDE